MRINSKSLIILILLSLMTLTSCLPTSPKSNRRSTTQGSGASPSENPPAEPTFSQSLNFFQNGGTQSSSTFALNVDYSDSFYLRGPDIDNFLGLDSNRQKVHCLVTNFYFDNANHPLVLAATPGDFYNFTTQSREDYFLFTPNAKNNNQSFCQTSGLITKLNEQYGSCSNTLYSTKANCETNGHTWTPAAISYDYNSLCGTCQLSEFTSMPLAIYDPPGTQIDLINISYMNFRIINSSSSQIPIGSSCTSSSECIAKGFDCCSSGQCVQDLQQRSNIDTNSAEYIQAAQEIIQNPANIYSYPNFFHICSVAPGATPTPTPVVDEQREAYLRFLEKQELYECTVPIKGEMALCTITYPNATTDGVTEYYTGPDDRSFYSTYTGTTGIPQHSIDRIIHAGETLFENNTFLSTEIEIGINNSLVGNDNLNDTLRVEMTHSKAETAPDDDLKIRFKIDGSCEQISTFLAKCKKHYVQGQNIGSPDDHYPASNEFVLPFYADLNRTVQVLVDDTPRLQGTSWNMVNTSPAKVQFLGTGLQVYDTQEVIITYFVDTSTNPVLTTRLDALNRIKDMCNCADTRCRLRPRYQAGSNTIIEDYICQYPQPDLPPPPLQQTVLMSTKTVPHRYFDEEGVPQSVFNADTPPQEGLEFSYDGGDLLKPNNLNAYVGFNEINGSFTKKIGSAKPALEVRVERGKTYDIFANSGTYSTCFFCGNDYYTNVAKVFPNNFTSIGSGYRPDPFETSKFNTSFYRGDDLLFGRACWVPAAMLPWSHDTASDRQQQRLKRQQAQHFLFANGYQRDWYGFDYGALIGSFDGVSWFAIGNQRRIKATTNKLYLALNQYFGDLTQEGTYSITVSASSATPGAGSLITTDFQSDGAECQQFHTCQTDMDCARQLGWDYVCENVSNLTTKWPSFDANALEIPETEIIKKLYLLNGTSSGTTNRCVYRGRGAPCIGDYNTVDQNLSYSGTREEGFHMCNSNNYCQRFVDGVPRQTFNDKISRYGKSVKVQNASSTVPESDLDTFGLGVRSIGRPYKFNGDSTIPSEAQSGLANNGVSALCIPGRNPADIATTARVAHGILPGVDHLGDLVTGIGITPTGTGPSAHYLSSCSVFGTDENYVMKDTANANLALGDPTFQTVAEQHALPTNSLKIFNANALVGTSLTKIFEAEQITAPNYQENRCLRAPGSACFSEMDCGPNNLVSSKINIVKDDGTNDAILNKYEIMFWKEKLVCSQEKRSDEDGFDLKNNRCCRELGNTLTIGTSYLNPQPTDTVIDNVLNPATEISLDSRFRYSRMSTIKDLTIDPATSISAAANDRCVDDAGSGCINDTGNGLAWGGLQDTVPDRSITTTKQWELIDKVAARTCCSGNWIRNFNKLSNGGGHKWGPLKHQSVDKRIFKCLNWATCNEDVAGNVVRDPAEYCPVQFSCSHTDSPLDFNCLARSTPDSEAEKIFNVMNKLEMMGIPQIKMTQEDLNAVLCVVNPDDQRLAVGFGAGDRMQRLNRGEFTSPGEFPNPTDVKFPTAGYANEVETVQNEIIKWPDDPNQVGNNPNLAAREAIAEYADGVNGPGLYSLRDETNFDDSLSPRFSEDEYTCCKAAGETLRQDEDASVCCTGVINPNSNTCALPDYTNVSLYYNRYISSAAKGLDPNLIDSETGYIKSANVLAQLACTQNVCISGVLAKGVAHSNLLVKGKEDGNNASIFVKRFLDGNDNSNNFSGKADFYDAGLKWNNDYYCIPLDAAQNSTGLELVDCANFN